MDYEDQLTAECFRWAWNELPQTRYALFHVPNEGKDRGTIQIWNKLRQMGVIPGMFDFVLMIGEGHGIEIKRPGQYLTKNQENVHRKWNAQGRPTWVVYDKPSFQWLLQHLVSSNVRPRPVTTALQEGQSYLYNFKYY